MNNVSQIFEIQPILKDWAEYAESLKHLKKSDRFRLFYSDIKPGISRLVGWYSKDDRISDPQSYDVVYRYFVRLMGI